MSEEKKDESDLRALLYDVELSGNYFEDCNLLMRKLDKLQQFAKIFASCPCCYEVVKCKTGCKFEYGGFEDMDLAREAMFT